MNVTPSCSAEAAGTGLKYFSGRETDFCLCTRGLKKGPSSGQGREEGDADIILDTQRGDLWHIQYNKLKQL